MKQIKSNFKPECQTLFEYITSFLRELASNQGQFTFRKNAQKNKNTTENGLTAELLAEKFRYSMLRADPSRNRE